MKVIEKACFNQSKNFGFSVTYWDEGSRRSYSSESELNEATKKAVKDLEQELIEYFGIPETWNAELTGFNIINKSYFYFKVIKDQNKTAKLTFIAEEPKVPAVRDLEVNQFVINALNKFEELLDERLGTART